MKRKKRSIRRYFAKAKKSYKRARTKSTKLLGMDLINDVAEPFGYGYVRNDVALRMGPVFDKVPGLNQLGNIKDEVGMIAVNTLVSRIVGRKIPFVRDVARTGIRVEAATMGALARAGQLGITASSSTGTQSFR